MKEHSQPDPTPAEQPEDGSKLRRERLHDGFMPEEYRHTVDLLTSGDEPVVKATLSNNINIIIAALRIAAEQPGATQQGAVCEHVGQQIHHFICPDCNGTGKRPAPDAQEAAVERVARAIAKADGVNFDDLIERYSHGVMHTKELYRNRARAAIAAQPVAPDVERRKIIEECAAVAAQYLLPDLPRSSKELAGRILALAGNAPSAKEPQP